VYGPRNIGVGDFEMPVPGRGQVLIQVKAAGICGSDLHYHRSDAPISQEGRIMGGHELSGQITALARALKREKLVKELAWNHFWAAASANFALLGLSFMQKSYSSRRRIQGIYGYL